METLAVKERAETGKSAARKMRQQGVIPCVYYGGGGDALNLAADRKELAAVLRHGEQIVELKVDGASKPAFVKEVQFEPLTEKVLHVDFVEIRLDEVLTVTVPLSLKGKAKGLEEGAIVEQILFEVEVSCLPTNVPDELVLDVTEMEVGDTWYADVLSAPEGAEVVTSEDSVVATCHMPRGAFEEEEEVEEETVEPVRVEKELDEEEKLNQQEQEEQQQG